MALPVREDMPTLVVTVSSPRGRINVRLPDDQPVNDLLMPIAAACGVPFGDWELGPEAGGALPMSRSLAESGVGDGSILELRRRSEGPARQDALPPQEAGSDDRGEQRPAPAGREWSPPATQAPLPAPQPLSRSGLFPEAPPAPGGRNRGAAGGRAEAIPRPPAVDPAAAGAASGAAPAAVRDSQPAPGRPAADFRPEELVKIRPPAPRGGLARMLYRASGGAVNIRPTANQLRYEGLVSKARSPLADPPARIAMASAKGGVGKTTMTLMTTSQLGLLRNDRVIAVECNPHHGTCRSRVPTYHNRGIKDLLDCVNSLERPTDLTRSMLSRFTTQEPEARLEVLTAPIDPAMRQALEEADYRSVLALVDRYFDIVTMDLGTGLLDPVTQTILGELSDQVVVIVPAALDGAELGMYTLKFITARRGAEWVKEHAIVVVNMVRKDSLLDVDVMERHFADLVRSCVRIRWDRHLETGGILNWEMVDAGTRDDFLVLAATLGEGFTLAPS